MHISTEATIHLLLFISTELAAMFTHIILGDCPAESCKTVGEIGDKVDQITDLDEKTQFLKLALTEKLIELQQNRMKSIMTQRAISIKISPSFTGQKLIESFDWEFEHLLCFYWVDC